MPEVPVPVWQQIAIVVVFAFLLAGLGWLLVKIFSDAIEKANATHAQTIKDINAHYANLVTQNNAQWQVYFDARSESNRLVNTQVIEKLGDLTEAVGRIGEHIISLTDKFDMHDQMERQALDSMSDKRSKLAKGKSA
jgi:hypothetical protein